MKTTKQAIYDQQQDWATRHHVIFDAAGYTATVAENLFQPLSEAAQAQFGLGAGSEMKGKMRALHSSSALVCNVFEYWRNHPMESLSEALGAPAAGHLHFEQVYPTGLRGIPPHIDVALLGDDTKPFCVESKFTEPYGSDKNDKPFEISYFPEGSELWAKHGLTNCQALAEDINRGGTNFAHLGAPQLLKHILGLANKFGKDFTLLYLWYDYSSDEATVHSQEIDTFVQNLNGEVDFCTMTYQDLFQKMQANPTVDEKYVAYLKERYFP